MRPLSRWAWAGHQRQRLTSGQARHLSRNSRSAEGIGARAERTATRPRPGCPAQVVDAVRMPERRAEAERPVVADGEAALPRPAVEEMAALILGRFRQIHWSQPFARESARSSSACSMAAISSGDSRSAWISALRSGSPS